MRVKDLLFRPGMPDARLLVGGDGLEKEVTGVNVLEAVDIENWGRSGLALLSSYYALKDLPEDDLRDFFRKLEEIQISAIIIKVARLVEDVPPLLVELCQSHGIPLIQIGKDVSYQDVMVDVLGSMLATREHQLSLYYRLSNISSQMSLEMLSLREILTRFRDFLGRDLSLFEQTRKQTITTNPNLAHMIIGERLGVERSGYMTFHYERFRCFYSGWDSGRESTVLQVDISVIEDRQHFLIVHEPRGQEFTDNEVVIVENLIRCLQTALLREFAGRQQQMISRNALIGDLIRGYYGSVSEQDGALESLGVDPGSDCQVLTIEYATATKDDALLYTNVKNRIRWTIQSAYPDVLFYVAPNYVHFVMTGKGPGKIALPVERIGGYIRRVFNEESVQESLHFFGGVSDRRPVRELAQAAATAHATARFLRTNGKPNSIAEYDTLGVFKLFVQSGQHDLRDYVPQVVRDLHAQYPDLYETLRVYLNNGQNMTRTAEEMHLHPKTVKYRVAKLPGLLGMDITEVHNVTILATAIEIIQYSHEENGRGVLHAS